MCPSEKQVSSTSDEKPLAEQPPVNVTSISSQGQHSTSSSADDNFTQTQSRISFLDVAVTTSHSGRIRPTGDNILGRTVGRSVLGELRPPRAARGCTDWYDVCTEILGFESLEEKMDVEKLPAEVAESPSRTPVLTRSRTTRTCGLMREKTESKSFPPVLSTLERSGRSRFSLERVRTEDGRLRISMVERTRPEIVRTSSEEGRVVMKTVRSGDEEDEVKNSMEKNKNEEQEDEAAKPTSGSPSLN